MTKVIDWILDHRWAMLPSSLSALVDIVQRNANINIDPSLFHKSDVQFDPSDASVLTQYKKRVLLADTGELLDGTRRVVLRGRTAILPIIGPIFPRSNLMTAMSGATSLQNISSDFNVALNDPRVESIILDVDSPGGEITDVEAIGEMIYQARERKPIIAFTSGMAASAGFWIASSASELVAARTGEVGSIGVVAAIRDTSAKDEKSGVQNINIVSSISPNKRPDYKTEAGRQGVQKIVDDLGIIFAETVARNRGVTFEDVVTKFGRGDMLLAQDALAVNMIDNISSLEALINRQNNQQLTIGGSMPKLVTEATSADVKAENPGLYNAIIEEGKKVGFAEAQKEVDAKVESAKKEGAEKENARIKSIEAIDAPESKELIAEAKFDMKQSAESVAVKILEDQKTKREEAAKNVETDATNLGNKTAGIGAAQEDPASADELDKSVIAAMASGINSK